MRRSSTAAQAAPESPFGARTAPRLALRRLGACAAAALLFAGLYLARTRNAEIADAVLLMFVVPIAIVAFEFGLRGGLAAASSAITLVAVWDATASNAIGAIDYLTRATAFLVIGAGIGWTADMRRALEKSLIHAQDMSLDMIATAGRDGFFLTLNPAWERVLGLPRATLLSRPIVDFIHPDDVEATSRAAARLERDGDVVNFRNRYRTADGNYCWLEWNAHLDVDEGVIYATARDVTVQHEAETVLADHAEVLERAVLARTAALDVARVDSLRRLAVAAEFRDDDTHQHTSRVGLCAAAITAELGLTPEFAVQLKEAAPLHDVGKIGVSDTILLKPGRLTPAEHAQMQEHARIGAEILCGSDFPVLQLAAAIALSHHERWDGTGYPDGLQGAEIPIEGRIVAVADVFDALTHARPYKEAWPAARALDVIRSESGTHFDPEVVAAFERLQGPTTTWASVHA